MPLSRRQSYTRVERDRFENPDHVRGMGDRLFRGFQCLNKLCTDFLFVLDEEVSEDFEIECPTCQFVHRAGETETLYDYTLLDRRDNSTIETGEFQILHDDYVREAKGYKYCIVCGALKPLELFDRHSSRRTGRQGECTLCKQVYNSIKNQTRLTEQHREASQKRRLYTHFKDSTPINVVAIKDRFENKCFKCGCDLSGEIDESGSIREGNLDHTLPVFWLWPLTTDNATLLCKDHNSAKAEKWPRVFYNDAELRRLASLTGIEYRVLAGEPFFNPDAMEKLKDEAFVVELFEKFARYPQELLRLRNRILEKTGFDFLDGVQGLSPAWKARADELRGTIPSETEGTGGE